MKKNILLVLLLIIAILQVNVNAASLCSHEKQVELQKKAASVKVTYEEATEEADPNSYGSPESVGEQYAEDKVLYIDYFKLKILNVTEDIYIKLENSVNKDIKYIRYEDTDEGEFTIDWKDLTQVVTFTYTIYTSDQTECPNEQLYSGIVALPMKNRFYSKAVCRDIPEFELCQKYTTINISYGKFEENVKYYLEKKNKVEDPEEKDNILSKTFWEKNKIPVIIGVSIIFVGGVVTTVIVIKKRRSRVL